MTSLVEVAIESRPKGRKARGTYTKDEIELALAWVDGVVSGVDVVRAVRAQRGLPPAEPGKSPLMPYPFLANALKQYLQELWRQQPK